MKRVEGRSRRDVRRTRSLFALHVSHSYITFDVYIYKSSSSVVDYSHLVVVIEFIVSKVEVIFRNKAKMQAGRSAAGAMKEKASNAAASARAGMEKTKATAEEKVRLTLS